MAKKLYFYIHQTRAGVRCDEVKDKDYPAIVKQVHHVPRAKQLPQHDIHFVAHKDLSRQFVLQILGEKLNELLKDGKL